MSEHAGQVHSVWDQMAPGWTRETDWLWEATHELSEWLVDRLAPKPGQIILEIAAGTGDTGFLAATRLGSTGKLICSDFVQAMLDGARSRAVSLGIDNVEFRLIDAQDMDLADEAVDGVLCRWGYMLMPDPARALNETHRVLKPRGRLAFSVFASPEDNPWVTIVGRSLAEIDHPPQVDPSAPGGIFSMSDRNKVHDMVTAAGFASTEIVDAAIHWRFRDFDALYTFYTEVAGAIARLIAALPETAREMFKDRLRRAASEYECHGGYDIPGACLNALATAR